MKNVAFIVTKAEIGGAQTWTNEMMKLVRSDCSVHLITSEEGWLTEQGNFDKVLILPQLKKHFSLTGYFSLLKYIKNKKIKVMIASSANAGIYSRMAKLFSGFRCIYVSHGWSCIYNGGVLKFLFIKIEKYLSHFTDVIWCVSKSDEEKARGIIGIRQNKIVTLTNSIPKMKCKDNHFNNKRIVFVGRLTHPKRPELLAEVVRKHPDIKLDVVGGGDYLEALKDNFKGCANNNFLGEINSFDSYANYDLFALISDSEGLPMSGLEAHTAGIPILISDVGGCKELIDKIGIVVSNVMDEIEKGLLDIFDKYESYLAAAQLEKNKFDFNSYSNSYKKLILES